MKARELAEILLQHPDSDVVIEPSAIKTNEIGLPMEQEVKGVRMPYFWNLAGLVNPIKIKCGNF